jgi:hypothetical protein
LSTDAATKASPARWLAAVPALLLAAVAVWETVATRLDATGVPDDAAWARAEQVVRAQYRPGDLIVFAPGWVDPVGRLHLGDLISLADAGRMDAADYARIWELSIRGAHAPETTDLAAAFEDAGDVTVRRYEQAPAHVVADVRRHVDEATPPHLAVDAFTEVGFAPHDCVVITARPGAATRVTFPHLPLGRTLVGYVGIPDVFERRDYRDPGTLSVEIGGTVVATATAGVDDGWVRFEAATAPGAADVAFVAATTGRADQRRRLCFAAEARQ